MVEEIFKLEDAFKDWIVSLEFLLGSCLIITINLLTKVKW